MKRWFALIGAASAIPAWVAIRHHRRRREESMPIGGVMDHAQTQVFTPEHDVVDDKLEEPVPFSRDEPVTQR